MIRNNRLILALAILTDVLMTMVNEERDSALLATVKHSDILIECPVHLFCVIDFFDSTKSES